MGIREIAAEAAQREHDAIGMSNGVAAMNTVAELLGFTSGTLVSVIDTRPCPLGEHSVVHLGEDVYVKVDSHYRTYGPDQAYLKVVTEEGRSRGGGEIRTMRDLSRELARIDERESS